MKPIIQLKRFRILERPTYRLWILSIGFLMTFFSSLAQETFIDNFNVTSYANNNGTLNWSGDWIENDPDGAAGPVGDYVGITGGRLFLHWALTNSESIRREADLTGAGTATLSFDWETVGLDNNEDLSVQISNNGGASYTTLATLGGTATGSFSQNILAYASSNTTIRFINTGNSWESGEYVYIDNVTITANFPPSIRINDVSVNEADGTAIFTVILSKAVAGAFTVNYATLDGTATAGFDYTSTSGTLNFSGTSGETHDIIVPIINDTDLEGTDETFQVNLSGLSDPSILLADGSGLGTIVDDDYTTNQPLVLFDEFDGYMDYAVTAGTFRTLPNPSGGGNDACQITSTSSNNLTTTIPAGATIEKAYLLWAHSGATPDTQVTFIGNTVNADKVYQALFGTSGATQSGLADVTTIIQGLANPSTQLYTVTDLTIDTSATYCDVAGVLGGWALYIFYSHSSLPASTINLYQGYFPDRYSPAPFQFTLDGFYAIGGSGSKTTVLSWEGDPNLDDAELLTVDTPSSSPLELVGDGVAPYQNVSGSQNPFNSTLFDNTVSPIINNPNLHGVDLDTYDLSSYIQPADNSVTVEVQVGQDLVMLGSVILKVPSNLVTGTVFEDVNYGGGAGRNLASASGQPSVNTIVEIYDNSSSLIATETTDSNGKYVFAGMANGSYSVRVPNEAVKSSRTGGDICNTCIPVQTFRTNYLVSTLTEITNEIGGANPAGADTGVGILAGAQTVSSVTIANEGVVGLDFGFNFNTIVNTNGNGQGSLAQFIENSNNLGNAGLDIEANGIFDPASGEDVSVFMIPPTGDILGRTADLNYNAGVFTINQNTLLPLISDPNTHLDGRTQTAYSGDSNTGSTGGGETVGTAATLLPTIANPEIQVAGSTVTGDIFRIEAEDVVLRNMALYSTNNQDVINTGGTIGASNPITITENLIGVDATGAAQNSLYGIEITAASAVDIDTNYIAQNGRGIYVNGGISSNIINNHFDTNNPNVNCIYDAITLETGTGIQISRNLIENSGAQAIDMVFGSYGGNTLIDQNTIRTSGQSTAGCIDPWENYGISLTGSNNTLSGNVIYNNSGAGVIVDGAGTANLITQNSIYNNGTSSDALGIDLGVSGSQGPNGITLNDSGDIDSGPNGLINFPVFQSITTDGINLKLRGWAQPGTIIELFITDIAEGTASDGDNQLGLSKDYGEGQTYLTTLTEGSGADLATGSSSYADADGNNDTTNKFEFVIPLPAGVELASKLTATGTLGNSTSEFSTDVIVKVNTVITNRKITYRVKKN